MLTDATAAAELDESLEQTDDGGDWITTTLPVCALVGYEQFAAVDQTANWLPVVRSARVLSRSADGRPKRVSFMAQLERASIGYQLEYKFDDDALTVHFSTPPESNVTIAGWARFSPLGHYACMLEYQLTVNRAGLPMWQDPFYEGHAPSAVLYHFRDHIHRLVR